MAELDERGAVKGVFWSVLQASGVRLFSFLVFVVLARLLSPADFGLLAMAGVFVALSQLLVEQGFGVAIAQRESLEPEHESTAFWTNLACGLLLAALFWLGAPWIADLYRTPELTPVVRWLSPVILLRAGVAVPVGLLQRRFEFRALAVRSLLAALLGGLAGIAAGFAGWGVYALVLQQFVAATVDLVVVWGAASWWPKAAYSWRHLRELASFGSYLVASGLFGLLTRRSNDFLIAMVLGDVALGIYAVAYRGFEILVQLLSKPAGLVAVPAYSRLQNQPERMREAFYSAVQAASVITAPAFVGVSLLAPVAVPLVFGDQYVESGAVLRPLALMGVVYSLDQFKYAVYVGTGRPDIPLKLLAVRAALNLLGFALAVRWGIVAVAIAHVVSAYLLTPLHLWVLRRIIGVSPIRYFASLVPAAAASTAMAMAFLAIAKLGLDAAVLLALGGALGAGVYIASLYLIAPALVRDLGSKLLLLLRRRPSS